MILKEDPIEDRIAHFKDWADTLVIEANEFGVVVTIRQESIFPPAMRHYVTVVEVREKR